jgi:hypothetical protein
MVVELDVPHVRGTSAAKDSGRQRVRAAFKQIASMGEWPTLAMIKQRVPDVSDQTILDYRKQVCRELGIAGLSGRVKVDLSLI